MLKQRLITFSLAWLSLFAVVTSVSASNQANNQVNNQASATGQGNAITLPAHQFADQWEEPLALNKQTQWLVVSQSKAAGGMVKDVFTELKVTDTNAHKLIYVADISAMPGFVTALFALPKMRDFAFRVALIEEDTGLQELGLGDLEQDAVSVFQLNQLAVEQRHQFAKPQAFKTFLTEHVLQADVGTN